MNKRFLSSVITFLSLLWILAFAGMTWAAGIMAEGAGVTAGSCRSCHIMKDWPEGEHARAFGMSPDRACLICHTRHPAEVPGDAPDFAYLRGVTVGGVVAVHNLCYQCHAASIRQPEIRGPDIYAQFEKFYLGGSAMPLVFSGHRPIVGKNPKESILLGSKPADSPHIECTDCHDPHLATRLNPLHGAKGIDVAGNPIGPGTGNPGTPQDYEICFRCHGDSYQEIIPYPSPPYRLRPPSGTNKRAEFSPETGMNLQLELKNTSFHPVAFPGMNDSKALQDQLSNATGGRLNVHSTIQCDDCHNNDVFAAIHGKISELGYSLSTPRGPHGSLNKQILRSYYGFEVGDENRSPYPKYEPRNFMLCFECHDEKAFDGGPRNTETNFYSRTYGNLHYLHLTGNGGKLPAYESCMECHYNTHSNVETDTTIFELKTNDKDTHLLWFYPDVKASGNNLHPQWANDGQEKSCAMVCHAHVMNYSYAGPDMIQTGK